MSNVYRCKFTGNTFSNISDRDNSEQKYVQQATSAVFVDDEIPESITLNSNNVKDFSSNKTVISISNKIMEEHGPLFERLAVAEQKEKQQNGALKFDSNKPPVSLIPRSALLGAARVLDMGKRKYSAHNWRKGMDWSRLVDATMRHLTAWNEGIDFDEESKESHLSHALVNLMFLIEYEEKKVGNDDRFKGNK